MPPKKVNKEFYFPFNEQGLLDYSDQNYPEISNLNWRYSTREWRKYYEFSEDMKICGYSRGRSSVKIDLESLKDSKIYPMFIKDFWEFINKVDIIKGVIRGCTYGFIKKGANYGIYLVKHE